MVLNEREIKIVEKLYYEKNVTLQDLSLFFNVSNRMIRYNISNINDLLRYLKLGTIDKNENGYYEIKNKTDKILNLIRELESLDKNKKIVLIKMLSAFSDGTMTVEYQSNVTHFTLYILTNLMKSILSNFIT